MLSIEKATREKYNVQTQETAGSQIRKGMGEHEGSEDDGTEDRAIHKVPEQSQVEGELEIKGPIKATRGDHEGREGHQNHHGNQGKAVEQRGHLGKPGVFGPVDVYSMGWDKW